jgi:hypothetical protein
MPTTWTILPNPGRRPIAARWGNGPRRGRLALINGEPFQTLVSTSFALSSVSSAMISDVSAERSMCLSMPRGVWSM